MRVLIADDEPIARRVLRRSLEADPDVTGIEEAASGPEALAKLRGGELDLAFLDIAMPGCSGIEALQALERPTRTVIVFVTAHEEHALEAFGLEATDYLLKPFCEDRLRVAVERAKRRAREGQLAARSEDLARLLDSIRSTGGRTQHDALPLPQGGGVELVEPSSIRWIEAADKHVQVHTVEGVVRSRTTIADVERALDGSRFLRVHRSCIVALSRVRRLLTTEGGATFLELDDGARVPVSRTRVHQVRVRLAARGT